MFFLGNLARKGWISTFPKHCHDGDEQNITESWLAQRGNQVKYYAYFDGYGHLEKAISEKELSEKYNNDPDDFLRSMCDLGPDAGTERTTGHVSTLSFNDEKELNDYLESLGDEITGFYGCESESRPYNF